MENKMPQKLTPFSQIKNSVFNGRVPLGHYKLDLRWLKTVSSTFQDVDFDGSLLPLFIS